MKRINASVMTVAVVLALIAFVAPSSAYSMSNGEVVPHSPTSDQTTWTFDVEQGEEQYSISHFVVAWCNEGAVESVTITPYHPNEWRYGPFNYNKPPCWIDYRIQGIKVDLGDNPPEAFRVKIILNGLFESNGDVKYLIKAGSICTTEEDNEVLIGPSACTPIPEFSTIAIPIASILGLLFFFNYRKRREK